MDIKKIKAIIDLVQQSGVAELEIIEGEEALKIKTSHGCINSSTATTTQVFQHNDSARQVQFNGTATTDVSLNKPLPAEINNNDVITSPMVGTFYRASAPGKPPFVEIGQKVEVGHTLCIIEAMKLMNEIQSEKSGIIKQILVEDGKPVEYGQKLFEIS